MLRLRGMLACAGLTTGWLAAAVMAAPPVLDRVPDDAMVVVAMPNAQNMQKNLQALVTATELPFMAAVPKPEELLAMGAGVTEGVDLSRALALVVAPTAEQVRAEMAKKRAAGEDDIEDEDPSDDPLVVLVPVTSYEALLRNFEATPGAAGSLTTVTMPDGSDGFLKDIGDGYAALSPNREMLTRFEAKSGPSPLKAKLGKAGDELSEKSDVVVVVNIDAIRPLWPDIREQMEQEFKEKAAALPMGEAAPNPMDNPALKLMADSFIRDGRALVGGLRTGGTGLNIDMAVNFSEGSTMARVFSGNANTRRLLSKLPKMPYLVAGAFDLSNESARTFMRELAQKNQEAAAAAGLPANPHMVQQIEQMEGASFVMGVPVGGLFGGLMTSTVMFTSAADPDRYLATAREQTKALNGREETEGVTTRVNYKEGSANIEGITADEYAVTFEVDPDSDMAAMGGQQAMQAFFGPAGGPTGYIAKAEGGVYTTFGKNSDLLTRSVNAGKGGEDLSKDRTISQVGDGLPSNRIAEAYVGTKGILDLIVPMAAMMFQIQVPPEQIPESLPPVGVGLGARDGAAHFGLFVPAPVIKTAANLAMTVQAQMEGGMDDMEDDEDEGTGQPRF